MKQLIAIALTLIMVCSLCACGRKPAETNPTTMPATTAATTAATTMPTTAATMPTIDTTLLLLLVHLDFLIQLGE